MSNPYVAELDVLLSKITGSGKVDEGQRRGIRRAIRAVNSVWENQMSAKSPEPTCSVCKKPASEIPDVVMGAEDEEMSPAAFAREDGTYNPETNHFVCTPDYIKIGMPSSTEGWRAP